MTNNCKFHVLLLIFLHCEKNRLVDKIQVDFKICNIRLWLNYQDIQLLCLAFIRCCQCISGDFSQVQLVFLGIKVWIPFFMSISTCIMIIHNDTVNFNTEMCTYENLITQLASVSCSQYLLHVCISYSSLSSSDT